MSEHKSSSERPPRKPTAGGSAYGKGKPSRSREGAQQRDGSPSRGGAASRGRAPQRDGSPSRGGGPKRDGSPARGGSPQGTRPRGEGERSNRPDRTSSTPPPPPSQKPKFTVPDIPEDISASMLDKQARARLRTLSKDNAEDVGRHLVMAGQLLDEDPELAYRYAQVALARGGRVDIVRESAAVTAYATGRYAEALREFRTVRRLNGSSEHLPLMADCERGLGRPARALAIAAEPESAQLTPYAKAELGMVVAGARADLGDLEAAHMTLAGIRPTTEEQRDRIAAARADLLDQLGRATEAAALRDRLPDSPPLPELEEEEDIIVYDLAEDDTAGQDMESDPAGGDTARSKETPAS